MHATAPAFSADGVASPPGWWQGSGARGEARLALVSARASGRRSMAESAAAGQHQAGPWPGCRLLPRRAARRPQVAPAALGCRSRVSAATSVSSSPAWSRQKPRRALGCLAVESCSRLRPQIGAAPWPVRSVSTSAACVAASAAALACHRPPRCSGSSMRLSPLRRFADGGKSAGAIAAHP